jgi:hypothetical protein
MIFINKSYMKNITATRLGWLGYTLIAGFPCAYAHGYKDLGATRRNRRE